MKNTSILILTLSCLSFAGATMAADQTPPSDAPPKVNPADDGNTAVTNLKPNKVKQTEQIIQNGQQTEIKVTNSVGTYIVKPNQSIGTSLPGDASSNSNNPVQWIVKSWGGSRDTENKDEAPPTLQPNPNPIQQK